MSATNVAATLAALTICNSRIGNTDRVIEKYRLAEQHDVEVALATVLASETAQRVLRIELVQCSIVHGVPLCGVYKNASCACIRALSVMVSGTEPGTPARRLSSQSRASATISAAVVVSNTMKNGAVGSRNAGAVDMATKPCASPVTITPHHSWSELQMMRLAQHQLQREP